MYAYTFYFSTHPSFFMSLRDDLLLALSDNKYEEFGRYSSKTSTLTLRGLLSAFARSGNSDIL